MARRTSTKDTTDTVETVEEVVETQAPVSEEKEEKAPAPEPDLTDFEAAVEAALDESDKSTGETPLEAIDRVNSAYRAIQGLKGKNAAKSMLDKRMMHAVGEERNLPKARVFADLKQKLSAGPSPSAPKPPADPTEGYVNKLTAVRIAYAELWNGAPEGVDEGDAQQKSDDMQQELASQVDAYREWLASDKEGDAPEVSAVVRAAFKIVGSKSGGGRSPFTGTRRNTLEHIKQVFESLDEGDFLTVNEIAKRESTEYGEDRPSPGAISMRLFPKSGKEFASDGIRATRSEDGTKGAVKDSSAV